MCCGLAAPAEWIFSARVPFLPPLLDCRRVVFSEPGIKVFRALRCRPRIRQLLRGRRRCGTISGSNVLQRVIGDWGNEAKWLTLFERQRGRDG